MQFGRSIIGALIGAAIGIGVMIAAYLALGLDTVWLALPVAILTGLGVRTMVATGGHASYLRGALTGALALGAYLLGWNVVAGLAQKNAAAAAQATRIEQSADADDKAEEADEQAEGEPAEEPKVATAQSRPKPVVGGSQKVPMRTSSSALEMIVLCVSALIAYELGRGTAAKPSIVTGDSDAPPADIPQGTHPDA